MIETVRRINLLTVLVLLLSGLLQPLTAAQGRMCARLHLPAAMAEAQTGVELDSTAASSSASDHDAAAHEHRHDHPPAPASDAGAPAGPCSAVALPARTEPVTFPSAASRIAPRAELPASELATPPPFRPPRLS